MVAGMTGRRGAIAAALGVVWVVWGSTYVAMRVGIRALPPLTMAGVRFSVAGMMLFGWCGWQRRRHPGAGWRPAGWREWRASAVLGLLLPAAGTGGATWAEQKLPAGTAALLLATIPVWLIIVSHVAGLERIRRRGAVGLALGLAGVAVLVNPLSGGAPDLGAAAVALGGALCWGCGSAYARRAPHPDQPLLASSMQLICAGTALCAAGAATGELGRIQASALASESALALAYLIVFGSLVAYSSYEWLVRHAPSQLTGTYAFVNPVVAVLLGWWLLGEHVSGRTLLAAAVIVAGVALLVTPARRRQHAEAPARDSDAGLGAAPGAEARAGRELGPAFGAVLDRRR
jgi:drug/metabolite transporter (DMT)-like permease